VAQLNVVEIEPADPLDHLLPVTFDGVDEVPCKEANLSLDLFDPVPTLLAERPVELIYHNLPMRNKIKRTMRTNPTPPLGYGPHEAE
jgi:hypothetical protein